MSRMHLPRWSLVGALLLTPAVLGAQAPTVVCKDGSSASSDAACAGHGGLDSAMTATAWKARGQAPPVETGQIDTTTNRPDMSPDTGRAGMARDSGRAGASPDAGRVGMATDTGRAGMAKDTGTMSRPGATGYQPPGSDTALKAQPGLQTGPARSDTGGTGTPDTTTATQTGAASDTALHARPQTGKTSADTGKVKVRKHRHHRAPADSARLRSSRIRADSAGTRPDSTR
jgi:hypothetical protein